MNKVNNFSHTGMSCQTLQYCIMVIYTAQNSNRNTGCFAIDHNTNARIDRLIAKVGLLRQKHVLVADQG